MKSKRILIVEDDLISAQYLKTVLEKEGFEVTDIIDSGEEAIKRLNGCRPDLVLMDIILKDEVSGIEAAIRHPECKTIFLTAYADEEMMESAVDAKAIAYLMKPYREKEIVTTVKLALSQKKKAVSEPAPRSAITLENGFCFDIRHDQLEKDGSVLPLSPTMLKLIRILSLNRGNVVTHEAIMAAVWDGPRGDSTLRALVKRFRNSIDKDLIVSVSGIGYMVR